VVAAGLEFLPTPLFLQALFKAAHMQKGLRSSLAEWKVILPFQKVALSQKKDNPLLGDLLPL
jgi:hypothetical protein